MKVFFYCIATLVVFIACQGKPEQAEDASLVGSMTSVSDVQGNDNVKLSKASVKKVVDKLSAEGDSIVLDVDSIDCYSWANTYLATTAVEDEEGDQFELYTSITLKALEKSDYTGTIGIYLSGCEEQEIRGTVTAKAKGNSVTVYFDQNIDGMEELFKKGDKIVQFEISYGEYVASWYSCMNDFVDEYTVLSLLNK